eukprot:TRINITY_DN1768_c1_g1_i5.p1 TRINITY_DN1768_c1_g1~~TRINITY_DN1768_c1_g1_i5.p1  ORF type:complete len:312 (-),score=9.63 TRINITY_DN1768_c1_g1_i5:17-952(-)
MRSTNQRNPKTFVSHSSNLSKAQRLESPKQPAFYKRFLSTMSRKHQVLTQRENATHNNHNGDLQPTLTKPKLSQRKQRHRKVVKSTANELVNGKDKVSGFGQWWGYMTGALVDAATVPFLFLLLPQIIKNFRNLVAGQATELMVLSWMSYLTALLGNTLLLSYFVAKQEIGASIIQVIGVASNMVILSQLYVAGLMPGQVFWSVALLQSVMAVISMAKVTGHTSTFSNAAGGLVRFIHNLSAGGQDFYQDNSSNISGDSSNGSPASSSDSSSSASTLVPFGLLFALFYLFQITITERIIYEYLNQDVSFYY